KVRKSTLEGEVAHLRGTTLRLLRLVDEPARPHRGAARECARERMAERLGTLERGLHVLQGGDRPAQEAQCPRQDAAIGDIRILAELDGEGLVALRIVERHGAL